MLLLDEANSSLVSSFAQHVVNTLRDLATVHDKTVVLTIHQPGFRFLELLHCVVVLVNCVIHDDARHHSSCSSSRPTLPLRPLDCHLLQRPVIATIKLLTISYQQDPRLMHAFVHHDVYASSMIAEVRIL